MRREGRVGSESLQAANPAGGVVGPLVTGRAQELAVRKFLVTAGARRLLVMEFLRGETAVSVVRTPTRGALTRPARSLPGETLHRFGETHAPSFEIPRSGLPDLVLQRSGPPTRA